VVIDRGQQSAKIPCVIDRITKRVRLFDGGQWLTEDEWLKTAPLLGGFAVNRRLDTSYSSP
jgi:hypothetical protein